MDAISNHSDVTIATSWVLSLVTCLFTQDNACYILEIYNSIVGFGVFPKNYHNEFRK